MTLETISTHISAHFTTMAAQTGRVLAALLVAVLILVIGLYVSRFVGSFVKKWLGKMDFDGKTSKLGVNELCVRFGLGKSPTYIISFVLAWAVIFYAVVLAADVLHLAIIRDLFTRFLEFIPTLFVSVLILFAGLLLGKLLGNIMENSAKANNLKGGVLLARGVYGFVVFFCTLAAVENLGLASHLVRSVAVVLLASFGLAFAIAVGLGAKPLVEEFLRGMFEKTQNKK
ncbi:mechanosensitive ion channel family protein [Candidatus Avelusimicrobium facis]|uniref:mechanosensitive ion channel family protein n=1 Tax=Candidatus Avelusimicrobium facis TaxID=3416203 RepID=UPI003D0ADAF9